MSQAPKKRDPEKKPLPKAKIPALRQGPTQKPVQQRQSETAIAKKWNPCPGCMGLGGMDGGCSRCGGTGYT